MFGLCFEQPDWGGILVSKCNGEDEKHPNSSAKSNQNCETAEPLLQTWVIFTKTSRMDGGDGWWNSLRGVMPHSGPDCYLPLHSIGRSTRTLAWTAGSAFPGGKDWGLNSTHNHSRGLHNDRKATNALKESKKSKPFKEFQVWLGHFLMLLSDLKLIVTIRKQSPTAPIPFSPMQVLFSLLLQKVNYHLASP